MVTYWQLTQALLGFTAATLVFQYFVMGVVYKMGFKAALGDIKASIDQEFKNPKKSTCFYLPEEVSGCVH